MTQSIEQLKKQRDNLLRKAKARNSLNSLSMSRDLERKKLKAEISALKSPGSVQAIKNFKSKSVRLGKFLKRRAEIVSANIEASQSEGRKPQRRKPVTRKKRKPTTSRSVRR